MKNLIIKKFLHTLKVDKKITREDFYESFLDFLGRQNIKLSPNEEDELEIEAFHKAKETGIIGYDIITSITDMSIFSKKFSSYIENKKHVLFHIFYEEDADSSLNEVWKKWNNIPPMGWIAGWCASCGEFFPYTVDLGTINMEKYTIEENGIQRPIPIKSKTIQKIDFCANGFMRLTLNDEKVLFIKPFSLDVGLVYKFIDNPLKILEC